MVTASGHTSKPNKMGTTLLISNPVSPDLTPARQHLFSCHMPVEHTGICRPSNELPPPTLFLTRLYATTDYGPLYAHIHQSNPHPDGLAGLPNNKLPTNNTFFFLKPLNRGAGDVPGVRTATLWVKVSTPVRFFKITSRGRRPREEAFDHDPRVSPDHSIGRDGRRREVCGLRAWIVGLED